MKYAKMLGLLAIVAAALMAFAGPAAATVTSDGTPFDGTLEASSSNTSLDGSVDVACGISTVEGTVDEGATSGPVTFLDFDECNKDTVDVLKSGTLSINSSTNVVTSFNAEVTVQLHRTVLGFPITTHCIYRTKNVEEGGTSVGTLIESGQENTEEETATTATLDIGSSLIPQVSTDGACGSNAEWTGTYTITAPDNLTVD